MKKLFFALAFTGIVAAASINTVSAITHSNVVMQEGEKEQKKKKKKKKSCCNPNSNTAAETKSDEKKCCASKPASKTGSCHDTPSSSKTESDVKK